MIRNRFTRKGFGNFAKTFILLCIGVIAGLFITMNSDADAFMYLTSTKKHCNDLVKEKYYQVKNNLGSSSGTTSTVSTDGLNLLLVAQMNESYAKDLLTLYTDNQQGKLNNYEYHMSVQALLGMQVNETNVYSGTLLPKSYLPFDSEKKKVIWNEAYKGLTAEQMQLRNFGNKEWETLGGGLCSWLNEYENYCTPWQMSYNQLYSKASISSSNNSSRTKGEHYYLPDNLANLDRRLTEEVYKKYDFDLNLLSESALSAVMSSMNNRGPGGIRMMCIGFPYNTNGDSEAYKVFDGLSDDDKVKSIQQLSDMYDSYTVSNTPEEPLDIVTTSYGRWIGVAIACHTEDWYFSEGIYDYFLSHKSIAKETWDHLYPDENITTEEIGKQIKEKCMNLNEAIQKSTGISLTSAQTKEIYNTSSDYRDGTYVEWRDYTIYHVSPNYKIKYSSGQYPLVGAYDIIYAGQAASVCILGPYIYSNLLKIGGVNVDVTNPNTYMTTIVNNSNENNDTYIPSGASWYLNYSIDTTKLNSNRVQILEKCDDYFGITYDENATDLRKNTDSDYIPTSIDSSTYVWRVYNAAGYTLGTSLKRCTINKLVNDSKLKKISWSDRKPGDILISTDSNLAGIYLSDKSGVINLAMSTGSKSPNISLVAQLSNLYVYKNKENTIKQAYGTVDDSSDTYAIYRYIDLDKDAVDYNTTNTTSNSSDSSGGTLKWGKDYDQTVLQSSLQNFESTYAYDNAGNKYKKGDKIGNFKTTGYCACSECSGGYGRQTSTGKTCTEGITVATDSSKISKNTWIIIGDHVFHAEDVGGAVKGYKIDIFVSEHSRTFDVTITSVPVYKAIKVE